MIIAHCLTPVIKDLELVGDWRTGLLKICQRTNNVAVFHVSVRIVVGTHDEDAGMHPLGRLDWIRPSHLSRTRLGPPYR